MGRKHFNILTIHAKHRDLVEKYTIGLNLDWSADSPPLWGVFADYISPGKLLHALVPETDVNTPASIDELVQEGIPFDFHEHKRDPTLAGVRALRFDDAGQSHYDFFFYALMSPPLESLRELAGDSEKLKGYLDDYALDFNPIPWSGQIRNSDIYRTRKLILPRERHEF